jgi:hypothetical protein
MPGMPSPTQSSHHNVVRAKDTTDAFTDRDER